MLTVLGTTIDSQIPVVPKGEVYRPRLETY